MKVLQINTVYPNGSTGGIAKGIKQTCEKYGIECKVAYRFAESETIENTFAVSSWLDCHLHNRLARITMKQGCYSKFKTKNFLKKITAYSPDIIHLHNIHGSFLNHKMLFNYIKKRDIKVVWTLHDCWALTGHCANFDMIGCDKWKSECNNCPQKNGAKFDNSKKMHRRKKAFFSGVKKLTFVTPSKWLADLAKQSFLKQYPINVINNGIDLSIFKPTKSDFRVKYGLENKKIILGVAFSWGIRKGLDVFIELAKRLPPNYQIILVGTNDKIDKQLPNNIISIHKTNNQLELAEIYSACDLFVNPTREEALGLVNIEALACGIPVITFNTGGSPECINNKCGIVVAKNDVDTMEREIIRVCENKIFNSNDCVLRAKQFDKHDKFKEYVELYQG